MKKILVFSLPVAILIFGFSLKGLLPKKDTMINHIALHVSNLQKSSIFYEQIVQLDSVPEPIHDGNHTWLNIGSGSNLHLIGGANIDTSHDKNTHLCFSVASINDFISRLNNAHIPYENWLGTKDAVTTRADGIRQIYFQDPDGYWIEINNDYK
jgi:lactoylglutathione lyase